MNDYIRFDWAMKRLLRDKANHAVLEGLMTSLLGRKYLIKTFLESEGNQEDENDKFNRVDILAEGEDGELIIFEIQNNRELYYFHRMLFGVSKAITDYISLGDQYDKVRKVYSINIVYFELGQGGDYVYHGKTEFRGLHNPDDVLQLSARQASTFFGHKGSKKLEAGDVFPEYYVLRVNDFDKVATTPLDEWIEFLKTGEIKSDATAPGLAEARACLRVKDMTVEEYASYKRHMENISYQRSVMSTQYIDGRADGIAEGRAEGIAEGTLNVAKNMKAKGISADIIADVTGLTIQEVENL